MQTTGAALTMRLLERQGIRVIAGIPGGASLPLYDALRASAIRHVLARHEQGAGFIAQGMARATGRAAVCLGTSGPGATNLLTAIADAKLDSIPLVAITGQVPQAMIGTDAFQEIDTYGLTVPITKHNFLVRSAEELLTVVPEAFRIATSGRPGPVLIDIPKDVQLAAIDPGTLPAPGVADPAPRLAPEDVERAAALIAAAERPVLFVGAGVIAAGAAPLLRWLSERASIPTVSTLLGLGAMPHGHPRFLGMVGMHAARCTNLVLEECDLLIALGVRFDDRATGKVAEFCPRARVLHVDIDPSELGKIRRPSLGIVADVGETLRALEPRVQATTRSAWLRRVAALRAAHPLAMPGFDDSLQPYGLVRAAAAALPPNTIVTTDVGQHQMWVAQAFPFTFPRQLLTSGGLGTMGFGLPAAIGASLAHPDRRVVCFSGDGSLLMNLQELATAAEEQVDVKIVLLNNAHLGLVRQQQELFYGSRFYGSRFAAQPDFAALARAFGIAGVDLAGSSSPADELAAALATPGPVLVNVPIAEAANVYPMVPPGGANRDMIDGGYNAAL
jgi:acetolactate synthase-1/2/3 large subunit